MGSSCSPGPSFDNDNHYALGASACIESPKVDAIHGRWSPSQCGIDLEQTPRTLPASWELDTDFAWHGVEQFREDALLPIFEEPSYDSVHYPILVEEFPGMTIDFPDIMDAESPDSSDQQLSPQIHTGQLQDQEWRIPGGANRRNICDQCRRAFTTGKELEAHAKAFKHRSYACTVRGCGKKYERRDVLQRHSAVHRNVWQWSCELCAKAGDPKSFTRKDKLVHHVKKQHDVKEAESFLEAIPSKKKKSPSSVCSDLEMRISSMDEDERSSDMDQSMHVIHQWLSTKISTTNPDGKKTEPVLSRSCANAFIKDLATAVKQECST